MSKVSMHNKARRRARAKARFNILTKIDFAKSRGIDMDRVREGGNYAVEADRLYHSYVERKNQERIALGIKNIELQTSN